MNRKQRRAKGIKNSDPAFMVKSSDMRSHINSMLQNDPEVQRAIKEEAHRTNLLEAKQQSEDIDTLILMGLHKIFGFGRKRLLNFVEGLKDLHKYYNDLYEEDDIYAMKKYLKEKVGIDVSELQEVDEDVIEENTN